MRVAGVDGCRGGWVAALVDLVDVPGGVPGIGGVALRLVTAAELPDLGLHVGIDIPIGLPDGPGRRAADAAARAMLPGRRGASVFPVPVRAVLAAGDYAQACAVSRAACGRALSKQTWYLVPKIAEVDAVLSPAHCGRVGEVHPEVAFSLLAGGDRLPPKKTAAGRAARERLLVGWLGTDVRRLVDTAPRPARADDALDALACAWSAARWARGEALVLGDRAATDAKGLPQLIRA